GGEGDPSQQKPATANHPWSVQRVLPFACSAIHSGAAGAHHESDKRRFVSHRPRVTARPHRFRRALGTVSYIPKGSQRVYDDRCWIVVARESAARAKASGRIRSMGSCAVWIGNRWYSSMKATDGTPGR